VNSYPGCLSLAAVLVLGVVAGASIPSVFVLDLAEKFLRQRASGEFVQQMAEPMADMKAMVPKVPATSCAEAKPSALEAWRME
jgi:hypothetical protein